MYFLSGLQASSKWCCYKGNYVNNITTKKENKKKFLHLLEPFQFLLNEVISYLTCIFIYFYVGLFGKN